MLWRSMLSALLSTPSGPLRVLAWAMAFHGFGLDTGQSLAPAMVAPAMNSECAGYWRW
ncbi:hypothetical protein D3C86_1196980 [compost metagenome]